MLNKKISKKGFSLIELMVAVTILAIGILGIFLAFSNSWMGMADARDRTVATNYAREAMEDVKNMNFEMVTNENLGIAESIDDKFTRVITVNTESDVLKKVNTNVFWTNRQGQNINVETSTYINKTIFNPGEATNIVLYADPYYSVLPSIDETIDLIAVIKDGNGNTKIDWSGENICFNIISGSELGSLTAGAGGGVDTIEGIAQTTFTPSEIKDGAGNYQQGEVEIEATVDLPDGGGTISDIITITVTLGVVRIELNASPKSLFASGSNLSTSTVTATLVDAAGETVTNAPNQITFNITGEGTFVDAESGGAPLPDTFTMSNSEGIAVIYVKSIAATPGVATVIASSTGLLSGVVNIITTGVATSIFVSVDPDLIYTDDETGTTVTIEIQDINGNPVEYDGNISLTNDGAGTFEQNSLNPTVDNPGDASSASTTFSSGSAGTIIIYANGGSLTQGSAIIEVSDALIADTITITAIPKSILANGDEDSVITATIKQGSIPIINYDKDIVFEIISDSSDLHDAELYFNGTTHGGLDEPFTVTGEDYGNDGQVELYLEPASDVGKCTIKVSTYNLVNPDPIVKTTEVGFYSSEHHIELIAVPSKMLVQGDNCTVTAKVVDEGGTPVDTYNEDITFTILVGWPKNAKFAATGTSSLTTTMFNGQIDMYLIPQKEAGTVTLKASSFTGMTDITGYLNIQVVETLLELAPEPNINYTGNQVSFDIEVQGTEISLDKMQVSWSDNIASEVLNEIAIGGTVVYSNVDGVVSGTVVNTDDPIPIPIIPTGISTINLNFNGFDVMFGKTFNIIFNPSTDYYPVEFEIPST